MKGQCFCGSVKYDLTSQPQDAYYCHCRDCQYLSGSAFHVLGIVERGSINLISGKLSAYNHLSKDGSGMTRECCMNCGTPLFVTSTRFADIQMFVVSTLDEPEKVKPTFEIWTTSKVSWANCQPGIDSFPDGALDGSNE
jgi:hypothetical protein